MKLERSKRLSPFRISAKESNRHRCGVPPGLPLSGDSVFYLTAFVAVCQVVALIAVRRAGSCVGRIGSDRRQDLFGGCFGGFLCLGVSDGALLSDERTRALARARATTGAVFVRAGCGLGRLAAWHAPRGDELRLCGAAGALPSTRQDARALDPFSPSGGTRREPGGTARAQVNLGFCRPPRASVGGMPGLACIAYVKGRAVVFSRGRTPAKISTGRPAPLTVFLSISHNFARALPASDVVYNTQTLLFVSLFSPFGVVEAASSSLVTQTISSVHNRPEGLVWTLDCFFA